jgi:hypothetical protein
MKNIRIFEFDNSGMLQSTVQAESGSFKGGKAPGP